MLGLLFSKRCRIFEKNNSMWFWENLYVSKYLYLEVSQSSWAILKIDLTATTKPNNQ